MSHKRDGNANLLRINVMKLYFLIFVKINKISAKLSYLKGPHRVENPCVAAIRRQNYPVWCHVTCHFQKVLRPDCTSFHSWNH